MKNLVYRAKSALKSELDKEGFVYEEFVADVEAYTIDTYLGNADDYEGTYKTHINDVAGKLYTTKEDSNVLIVKLSNDSVVALKRVKN